MLFSILPDSILSHLHCEPSSLVEVFLGQSEQAVIQLMSSLVISARVREENLCIHGLGESRPVSRPHLLHSDPLPLLDILVTDGPILIRRTEHAMQAIKHIALRDQEARNIQSLILPVFNRRSRTLLLHRQLQQRRKRPPALLPRRRVDLHLSIPIERDAPLLDVEPVPRLTEREAELVPKTATQRHEADALGPAHVVDARQEARVDRVRTQRAAACVEPEGVVVRHHVRHAGAGGGGDDEPVRLGRRVDGEGDGEEVLVA
jgi:hypothetical protein